MTLHHTRGLVRIFAPTTEPLTISETKEFLRITHADDDARIGDMIVTARMLAEQWLRKSLITQSWKLSYEEQISGVLRLPMPPVQSITSVTTISMTDQSQTVPTTAYALSAAKDALVVDSIITGYRIEVVYVAGYGTSSQLPKPIKFGLLQHIASIMDGQMQIGPMPENVVAYYAPFRELAL